MLKISITPEGGSATVIGDEANRWYVSTYSPAVQYEVQTSRPARATSVRSYHRGLRSERVSFTVTREHASEDAAMDHLHDQLDNPVKEGSLKVEWASGSKSYHACLEAVEDAGSCGKGTAIKYTYVRDLE